MKINQSVNNTSFCSAKLNRKGVEKLYDLCGDRVIYKLQNTVKKAYKSVDNNLIVDEEGWVKIQNSKYGEFKIDNPPNSRAVGMVFSCDIIRDNGNVDRLHLDMPSAKDADKLNDRFRCRHFMAELTLDLFDAMEAVSNYTKKSIIDNIMKFSN